jgi:1-acyl-sn-glycerol-3-phosphate acyltransferase
MRVLGLMSQALKEGSTVAVFPEGTTGTGHGVMHFHGNLLQAAIDADVPVQPIALRYSDKRHAISPRAAYVGETTLVQSLWWVVSSSDLTVHVTILPPVAVTHADRRALAQTLQEVVGSAIPG